MVWAKGKRHGTVRVCWTILHAEQLIMQTLIDSIAALCHDIGVKTWINRDSYDLNQHVCWYLVVQGSSASSIVCPIWLGCSCRERVSLDNTFISSIRGDELVWLAVLKYIPMDVSLSCKLCSRCFFYSGPEGALGVTYILCLMRGAGEMVDQVECLKSILGGFVWLPASVSCVGVRKVVS